MARRPESSNMPNDQGLLATVLPLDTVNNCSFGKCITLAIPLDSVSMQQALLWSLNPYSPLLIPIESQPLLLRLQQ
jgi:hypothetical protein